MLLLLLRWYRDNRMATKCRHLHHTHVCLGLQSEVWLAVRHGKVLLKVCIWEGSSLWIKDAVLHLWGLNRLLSDLVVLLYSYDCLKSLHQ